MRHFGIGWVALGMLLVSTMGYADDNVGQGTRPINVGSEKQLFIDRLFFETSEGLRIQVNAAVKSGEKNVDRDRPWESATLNWFSVVDDPTGTSESGAQPRARYRMWYECYDIEGWPSTDDTSFCYAESEDGIVWTKPELGLYSYQESTKNNILFRQIGPKGAHTRVHGAGVFLDPAAPKVERYKGVSQGMFDVEGTPPYLIAAMYSADGIKWTRYPEPVSTVFADSQYSAFWDASLNQYVLYGRANGRGRAIGRATSPEFSHFPPLERVLQTEEQDPPNSDLYNPAALKYPYADRAYFMFPSLYRHDEDTLDIHLATSRDGINWTWPERGKAFIALGDAGEFDSGSLYMGQGLVRAEDTLYQYYGGSPLTHEESELETLVLPGNSRAFSRVSTRLDGFVSVEAEDGGGSFTSPLLVFTGDQLRLNVQIREGGYLRVGLLDEQGAPVPGRGVENCVSLDGDQTDALVSWTQGNDVSARAGTPTRLRVEMDRASLFAFHFSDRLDR